MRSGPVLGLLVGLSALLSGCAAIPGLGPGPLDTYELTTPSFAAVGRTNARRQILISEPTALKSLDGQNIVVKPTPSSIQFLGGAQWGDRLPKVVQARLAEAFQKSGKFGGVGRPGEGLAIDYQISVDIRAFEIRATGGQTAHVEFFVRILNDRNGVVRASRSFEASAPVEGTGNDAFVAALDRAFADVTASLVNWTISAI
ncbi:MAG: ABC-type transport auxiliary lipoprotein family protein [Mesorhizobium sp.]